MTTESYLVLCYRCNLQYMDLEIMTIGMCLDYIEEYVDQETPDKNKTRKATQSDFDHF